MTSSITTNIAHNSYKSIVENNWSRLINKTKLLHTSICFNLYRVFKRISV